MNEEILVKCKNGFWGLLSCITSILFTHYFFVVRNFYDSDPILYMDHAGHLAFSIVYGEYVLEQFFASYGYSYFLHSGFPFLQYFSPGYFLIVYFFHLAGFSYETAYKIVLFLLMIFSGMIPHIILKICNRSSFAAFIGTLWFWIGMPSFILRRFNTGGITMILGSALAIIFIIYSLKIDVINCPNTVLAKKQVLMGGFLFLIAYTHISAVVPIFLVISEVILIKIVREKSLTYQIQQIIWFYIKISILGIGLLAFWLFPTLITHSEYNSLDPTYYITSYDYSLFFTNNYIQRTYISLIVVCLVGAFLYFRVKENNDVLGNSVFLIILNSGIIVFLLPLTQLPYFQGVLTYRYLIFLEFGCVLIVAVFFDEIKKVVEKYVKMKHTGSMGLIPHPLKKELSLGLILIPMVFLGIFPISGENSYIVLYGTPEVNYTEFTPEERDIMEWITNNTTLESRILFQNSGYNSGWEIGRGHAILYMALLTNRYFATGYTSQWYYSYAKATNFEDDLLYGKPLKDYSWESLEPLLITYNIEFVIVWSENALDFFNQTGVNSGHLGRIYNNSKFHCFQYLSAPKSYIVAEQKLTYSDFSIEPKSIYFKIQDIITTPFHVILSFHDYPNWKVFVNGQSVPKYQNALGLIEFIIEPEFNVFDLEVQVLWKRTPIEIIGNLISSLTFIGCTCLIVSMLRKKVNVKLMK